MTITLWHNYGGQMQSVMDELVDEFNSTVGGKGIIVSITHPATKDMQKSFHDWGGRPGAGVARYRRLTRTAASCVNRVVGPLTNSSPPKLDAYLPQFIKEGRSTASSMFHAKSTEVLFVNQTSFDRLRQPRQLTARHVGF